MGEQHLLNFTASIDPHPTGTHYFPLRTHISHGTTSYPASFPFLPLYHRIQYGTGTGIIIISTPQDLRISSLLQQPFTLATIL
jgi:hypothetical protein